MTAVSHVDIRALDLRWNHVWIRCPRGDIDLHLDGPQAALVALQIRDEHRKRAPQLEGQR